MADPEIDSHHPPASIVLAKTEELTPKTTFAPERDEKLDPLRGKIALGLTFLLFFTLFLHAGLTFWASYGTPEAPKNIAGVFNIWVPVIAGLTSSAITWFFTRQQ